MLFLHPEQTRIVFAGIIQLIWIPTQVAVLYGEPRPKLCWRIGEYPEFFWIAAVEKAIKEMQLGVRL